MTRTYTRPATPYPTVPDAGQRLTKRTIATYRAFNAAIEELLEARGAVLVRDLPAGPDSLIGHDWRTWRLTTRAGAMDVTPCGLESNEADLEALRAWAEEYEIEAVDDAGEGPS